jgi:FixJ family two-component response regulator
LPREPEAISIVDDDLSVRRALRRLVGSAGYLVETFASAHEFLSFAPPSGIGCLVLDVHMHGMSGLELQARLASECRAIPIIFMTAHDDARTRERIRTLGAAGYLSKPFDPQALLDAIRRVAGSP